MIKKMMVLLLACCAFVACEPEDIVFSGETVRVMFGAVKENEPPLKLTLINRDLPQFESWTAYQQASDGSGRKIVMATMGLTCHGCEYLAADIDKLATEYEGQGLEFVILFYETEEDRAKLASLPHIQSLQHVSAYYNSKDYPIEKYMWAKVIPGVRFFDNGVLWDKGHVGWYGGQQEENGLTHEEMIEGLKRTIDEFLNK